MVATWEALKTALGETDADYAFCQRLRARFTELERERRTKAQELADAEASPPARDHQTGLLHKIPMLQTKLAELPEELQRELLTAFRLEIRYDARLGVALIRITLDHETIEGVTARAEELPGNEQAPAGGRHLCRRFGECPRQGTQK
ncbi:hypothetical protein [Microbispora sp. H10830]|uniref:hypothetical protein n=1 Tax=Microbispora sp. H10830 TaxID=2729109 RepID=UPI0016048364|nr:hypothetical protein [Microbispora sp. H10830]